MGLVQTVLGNKTNVQFMLDNPPGAVISFDASIREKHGRKSPATEFEIEDGTTISDNIIVKPFTLEIDGMISDSPISGASAIAKELLTTAVSVVSPVAGVIAAAAGSSLVSAIAGSQKPSQTAYQALLSLQDSKESFDVVTSLKTYEDMWIMNLDVDRDAQTGNVLAVHVSLAQLIIVSPQSTNLLIFSQPDVAAPETNAGRQGTSYFSSGKTAGVTSVVGH